jgi:alpha-tubulin suppressor-like RCC1 family protein
MFAWGNNTSGQLGNNGVPYSTMWKQVSMVHNHTLLIRSDNTLWAVGANTYGQLGDNTTTTRVSPVQIGTNTYSSISAGPENSFAITTDNRLFVWGYNTYGELGQNDTVHRSSPVQIAGSWTMTSVTAYSNNAFTSVGSINTLGQLYMWGQNTYGSLGDNTTSFRSSPVQIFSSNSFTNISVGLSFTLAVDK